MNICIYFSNYYNRITSHECVSDIFADKLVATKSAENIYNMLDNFNRVRNWLVSELVSIKKLDKRITAIKKIVYIAQECVELNNFDTAISVISALRSVPVFRLLKTWHVYLFNFN